MTESMLLPTDVGTAISLREMAYAWEQDPLTNEGGRSLELLVARALQSAGALQLAWSLTTDGLKVWESGAYFRRVQAIDFLATVVADMLSRTREIVSATQGKYPDWEGPARLAEVDSRLQAVKQVAAKVHETLVWLDRPRPPVDQDVVRRSREAYDRGEGESVSEIIARLESGGQLVKE